ncbi:hypothetical protein ACFWXM_29745, partial [Achromobacter xylosoxidans]|uniref:hypothetical protein n=1 Tax=Alcaligenes xylosoxydans xylosoxydans TaxID=85698 RepID=UPI00375C4D41
HITGFLYQHNQGHNTHHILQARGPMLSSTPPIPSAPHTTVDSPQTSNITPKTSIHTTNVQKQNRHQIHNPVKTELNNYDSQLNLLTNKNMNNTIKGHNPKTYNYK